MKFIAVALLLLQLFVPFVAGKDEEYKSYNNKLIGYSKYPGFKADLKERGEIWYRYLKLHYAFTSRHIDTSFMCHQSDRDSCIRKIPDSLRKQMWDFD